MITNNETPKKNLKSLKQHNEQALEAFAFGKKSNSGIACPICEEELFYPKPNVTLMSYPPQKSVECCKCHYKGSVYKI